MGEINRKYLGALCLALPFLGRTAEAAMFSKSESDDDRRRREVRDRVERMAREAEGMRGSVIADQPKRLADFRSEHEKDVAGYEFRCERWGDFLAVFIKRGDPPEHEWQRPNKISTSINLGKSRGVSLLPGHDVDLLGVANFTTSSRWNEDAKEWRYAPEFNQPASFVRAILVLDAVANNSTQNIIWGSQPERLPVEIKGIARPAADDRIRFDGPGVMVHVPFGLGERVYQQILAAMKLGA